MPSVQFASPVARKSSASSIYTRPAKKQKMSVTQTYFLAHSARGKLSKEASRSDHNLRLLVGHANLLDSLMLDLASAEQEQEQWFTKSVSQSEEAIEEPEEDWEAEDADDSDSDAESVEEATQEYQSRIEDDEEDFEDDDGEDYEHLALTRTASRHEAPPELSSDSESDSEDDSMPPSPPSATIDSFPEHLSKTANDSSLSESQQQAFIEEGFYLPSRAQQTQQPTMIAAF